MEKEIINNLKHKIEVLEQQLKEKDQVIEQEVRYKQNERVKCDLKDKEINTLNEHLKLSFKVFNQIEDKILNIVKEILAIYGKTITDQKKQ